jgi:hypothetical protein
MPDVSPLRERLFKTRRLLLGISVVLLAHYALGIQIKSDAESLGLRFELPDVQRVWIGVWVVWTWAFVTYLQYCHELQFDDYPNDRLENAKFRVAGWFCRMRFLSVARTKGIQGRIGVPTTLTLGQARMTFVKGVATPTFTITAVWNDNDTRRFPVSLTPNVFQKSLMNAWGWFFVVTTTRFGTDFIAPVVIAGAALGFGIRSAFR